MPLNPDGLGNTERFSNAEGDSLDIVSGSVDGDEMVGFPPKSTTINPGFNAWTTADADRPVILEISVEAETDGGPDDGVVNIRVDESGGTTEDYKLFAFADSRVGTTFKEIDTFQIALPAGAQYQIENVTDPNSNNTIRKVRKFTL